MNADIRSIDIQAVAEHALALLGPRTLYVEAEPPEEASLAPFVISHDLVEVRSRSTDQRWASRSTEELIISVRQSGEYLREVVRLIRTYHQDQIGENDWVVGSTSSDATELLEAFSALPAKASQAAHDPFIWHR